jgi:Ca-activated chloride channel homolog
LKAVAEAGGGKFTTVKDEQDLNTYFENEKQVSFLDYLHWEIANYTKSMEIADKKRMELTKFFDAYANKLFTEEDRMLDACHAIHKDVLACTRWDELGRLIFKRHDLIWDWLWNLKDQAFSEIRALSKQSLLEETRGRLCLL